MKLSATIAAEINNRFHMEMQNWFTYLQLASFFDSKPLPGFSSWLHQQAEDELNHAKRWYDYLIKRGATPVFTDIKAPDLKLTSPMQCMKLALELEEKTTESIQALYVLANKEKDFVTQFALQSLLEGQVNEMNETRNIIETLEMVGQNEHGMLVVDAQVLRGIQQPQA
ncbi:ferritin [Carpediemonas membranifera]|uniref:Ferritin n=1 Tax=Carpediemonas membranifera TaxID=201153 RepID=A0A8J6B6G4_9EUKA|nr:ferritin [Carpediemonas membranifera]|eukprot:KAG9393827.1 ferritin [Carpediemonas membranifera]